jgi:DNA (cytosine-5)-methyltransferase 1
MKKNRKLDDNKVEGRFIDLFCGIGGFRIGFEKNNFQCVFSSDFNKNVQDTYFENFGERPFGDITQLDPNTLPEFDILTGGFPCQPFSISGKKLGFEDTRGTLFFDICRILSVKKPKVVVLENVQHFVKHDKGRTLKVVVESLQEFGYNVNFKVLNLSDFGLPQSRERVFIIGSLNGWFDFDKIKKKKSEPLEKFLDPEDENDVFLDSEEYTILDHPKRQPSGLIFCGYRNKNRFTSKGIRPGTDHLSRVHRQPNRIYSIKGYHPTLPSQETSGRFFIFNPDKGFVRKLKISECYRIMGFPENYLKNKSLGESYRQIGNSVGVNITSEISKQIIEQGLLKNESQREIIGDLRNLNFV